MRQGRVRGRVGAPLAALLIVTLVAVMGIVGTASAKPVGGQKWVLGVSNTLVGNGWREEMICAVKAQALSSGKVSKVIVANRNGGPAEQIADIRNLISAARTRSSSTRRAPARSTRSSPRRRHAG